MILPGIIDSTADINVLVLEESANSTASKSFTGFFAPSHLYMVGGRRFIAPLLLTVEKSEDDLWLATNPTLLVHGAGETATEAISDFVTMLFDLYEELTESEDVLAPHLQRDLARLRTIIAERKP